MERIVDDVHKNLYVVCRYYRLVQRTIQLSHPLLNEHEVHHKGKEVDSE
jgi:hypothetical protein